MTIDIEKLALESGALVKIKNEEYVLLVEGEMVFDNKSLKQFAEAYAAKVHDKRVEELEAKNRELSASINDLREALEKQLDTTYALSTKEDLIIEALSKTPEQHINDDVRIFTKDSLQEHDNEVVERCAKVVDESYAFDSDGFAKAIRALKVT